LLLAAPVALTLLLAACGSSSNSAGPGAGVKVTVGSKKDVEAQLLGRMYALLLQNKGYVVSTKLGLGDTEILTNAIKSGAVDIYPEFTGTALGTLKLQPAHDAQKDYQNVKQAYEQQFQITWLDAAYGLNDSYALCTSQANATKYNLKTLEDLAAVAPQLQITAQQDAFDNALVVPSLNTTYNLHFKKQVVLQESASFDAVTSGAADVNICYTTDPAITQKNFVILTDTKNAFPFYNPAPIVRDQLYNKSKAIGDALNPLSAKLTTAEIITLIGKVDPNSTETSVTKVATDYLKQQGLLP
jgi:osmoprotectant transport system substrate-binding protein